MVEYLNSGYVVFTDNFYTSSQLATALLGSNPHLVGTLKVNRVVGVPVDLKSTKQFEKTPWGVMLYVGSRDMTIHRYVKHVVTKLSTEHNATVSIMVLRPVTWNGQWEQPQVQTPQMVLDYNHGMGGVDLFNQRSTPYRIGNTQELEANLPWFPGNVSCRQLYLILGIHVQKNSSRESQHMAMRSFVFNFFANWLVSRLMHLCRFTRTLGRPEPLLRLLLRICHSLFLEHIETATCAIEQTKQSRNAWPKVASATSTFVLRAAIASLSITTTLPTRLVCFR